MYRYILVQCRCVLCAGSGLSAGGAGAAAGGGGGGGGSASGMTHFDTLTPPSQLESPTSSATPISPLHGVATQDMGRAGVGRGGGGGGGGGSLPQSPLLESGHHLSSSHSGQQVRTVCLCVCGGV